MVASSLSIPLKWPSPSADFRSSIEKDGSGAAVAGSAVTGSFSAKFAAGSGADGAGSGTAGAGVETVGVARLRRRQAKRR